ncbi:MAG: hypothetical protein NTY38_13075 [Acidobacteria bacterium]|nr:hypothetical protein [Acidobacteriota bacterium]
MKAVWNRVWNPNEFPQFREPYEAFVPAFRQYAVDLLHRYADELPIEEVDDHLKLLRNEVAPAILRWIEPAASSWRAAGREATLGDLTATGEWERCILSSYRSLSAEHPPGTLPAEVEVVIRYQVQLRYEVVRGAFDCRLARALEDKMISLEAQAWAKVRMSASKISEERPEKSDVQWAPDRPKAARSLSKRDEAVHTRIGPAVFRTLTNAEIMKTQRLKKVLAADFALKPGMDATKCCLDRIRRAKGYPLSGEIARKRSTGK